MRVFIHVHANLGKHDHPKGMQIVDKKSYKKMKFALWFGKLFFRKVPILANGHSDEDAFGRTLPYEHYKQYICGFVKDIYIIDNSIVAVCAYNKKGKKLIKSGKRFSTRWIVDKIGIGEFRPVKLISVALTDRPQIEESGLLFEKKEVA